MGYRFGNYTLYPSDRMLKRGDRPIALAPKAFDALLCLVRGAEHMVSKRELSESLWPDVHVSERNLTNVIVSLRKILGRNAIRTVSKYGYRFELPVSGEPGVGPETYERFMRARELTNHRSLDSMRLARDLYWTCLAENPNYAPAWAWLGRCCCFLDKFGSRESSANELSKAAFARAFAIDPDLASAHAFYTLLQVDLGEAEKALERLLHRFQHHPTEPELFSSLVQVLRFQGLLAESIRAHQRAVELDPSIATSVPYTLFLAGKYESAIEAYRGRTGYYLDAAAMAALDQPKQALSLLRKRLRKTELSNLIHALMSSLIAILEHKKAEAVRIMGTADTRREPEILVYFARHYARLACPDLAMVALKQAARSGFVCSPTTLKSDVWLKPLQAHKDFESLVTACEDRTKRASLALLRCHPCRHDGRSWCRWDRVAGPSQ